MLLGIDVGGTHTDAVVLDQGRVVAEAKVPTDHDNLLHSVRAALAAVLPGVAPGAVRRVNLSTTLSTNAIVEGKTEEVGVLVAAGPGIDPENHRTGGHFHVLGGSVDHRGTEVSPLDHVALSIAVAAMRRAGVRVFATVGKFSTRNPAHEQTMAEALTTGPGQDAGADHVTQGHTLSGVLNFPRRLATAYFNSAVWRLYNDFAWAVQESVADFGLEAAEINVLKADGGTMPLELSRALPVQSILSGPAASVMGMIALCDIRDDCVILDVGGTTTDIAVFADGSPVIEEHGMTVGSYPTLVGALKVRSIGVGGDSALRLGPSGVTVGPDRRGPALATCAQAGRAGGKGHQPCGPALTDALNVTGACAFGDVEASRRGLAELGAARGLTADELARQAVDAAVAAILTAARDLVDEINTKPVYTIRELLGGRQVRPVRHYVMGGPAQALAPLLARASGLDVRLPEHHAVANAIGAALTRTTLEAELFADTQKGRMLIPALDVDRAVPRSYALAEAEADVRRALAGHLRALGADLEGAEPEITESGAFNMVEDSRTVGRTIRVKCQVRPGIVGRAGSARRAG
jgi:N-methylhydantoinase A/oxoprolinase/acetone carboxylase beta subunit